MFVADPRLTIESKTIGPTVDFPFLWNSLKLETSVPEKGKSTGKHRLQTPVFVIDRLHLWDKRSVHAAIFGAPFIK